MQTAAVQIFPTYRVEWSVGKIRYEVFRKKIVFLLVHEEIEVAIIGYHLPHGFPVLRFIEAVQTYELAEIHKEPGFSRFPNCHGVKCEYVRSTRHPVELVGRCMKRLSVMSAEEAIKCARLAENKRALCFFTEIIRGEFPAFHGRKSPVRLDDGTWEIGFPRPINSGNSQCPDSF